MQPVKKCFDSVKKDYLNYLKKDDTELSVVPLFIGGGKAGKLIIGAALIAITKTAAISLAKSGVLINSIAPGSIAHPGGSWERFQQENSPDVVKTFIDANLPMGKFGWPGPVADLVAFLSSERAGMITGASIVVDGGQSKSII
jgi:3-oxoacyl-[acyl-carrier protein] reductase